MSTPRRRAFPWWLLLVAFVVVPLVEIYVLIQVGQVIGAWWTIVLLVADSILGAWVLKREGGRAWRALRIALQEHRMPHRELADGVLIVVGGTLMLTPGFVSDLLGILCILPFTRPVGRRVLAGLIGRKLVGASFPGMPGQGMPGQGMPGQGMPGRPSSGEGTRTRQRPGPGPDDGVVQGEVVDEGPKPPR